MWCKPKSSIEVTTVVDIFYSGGDIDTVERFEERQSLKGTVDKSCVIFGIDRIPRERSCLPIL